MEFSLFVISSQLEIFNLQCSLDPWTNIVAPCFYGFLSNFLNHYMMYVANLVLHLYNYPLSYHHVIMNVLSNNIWEYPINIFKKKLLLFLFGQSTNKNITQPIIASECILIMTMMVIMTSFEINGQRECASNQRRTFCNNFPINIRTLLFNQAAELSQADVTLFKSSLIKTKYKTDESGKIKII